MGIDPSDEIDVDGELEIVKSLLGNITVLKEDDATVENVLKALPNHETVHFACHGSVDRDTKKCPAAF